MAKRAKKRPSRWLLRAGAAVVVLLTLLWLLHALWVPRLVRSKVADALHDLGLADATFELRNASLWGAEVSDITGGGKTLQVGNLKLDYGPVGAMGGRVDVITLRGAELRLSVRNGALQLGPLTLGGPGGAAGGGELPFGRLRVLSSTLRLDWEGRQWWLPIAGTVTNRGGGKLQFDLDTFAHGSPVTVGGGVDQRTGTATLALDASDVNLGSLAAAVPPGLLGESIHVGGQAGFGLSYRRGAGQTVISLTLQPRDAWGDAVLGGRPVVAEKLTGRLDADLDGSFNLSRLTLDAGAATVRVGDDAVHDVRLGVRTRDGLLAFVASAAGDGWRLRRLEGELEGLLGGARSSALAALVTYELDGRLPRPAAVALRRQAVQADRLGALDVSGEGVLRVTTAAERTDSPDSGAWSFQTPQTRITLAPGGMEVGARGPTAAAAANVEGLTGVLNVGGTAGPRGASMILLGDCWLEFQSVARAAAGEAAALDAGRTHIALMADEQEPAVRVAFDQDGTPAALALRARAEQPGAVRVAGTGVKAAAAEVRARVALGGFGPVEFDGEVRLEKVSVEHKASGTVLADISAAVPVTWNRPARPKGRFAVGSVATDKQKLPAATGGLRLADGRAEFDLAWPVLKGANLWAAGWLAPGEGGVDADVEVAVPAFRLDDGAALAKLVPALGEARVGGTLAAGGRVRVVDGQVQPRLQVSIKDGRLEDEDAELRVEGAAGAVTVIGLSPLRTEGGQRLAVKRLSKGDLAFTDGAVAFTVERPDSILIEQTQFGWAGGQVYTHAFRLNPAEPDVDVVLYADGLNVRALLDTFAEGRASGEGELYGRLPVSIHWPRVTFGEGFLYSRPGRNGQLQFGDAEALGQLMAQSDPRFAGNDGVAAEVKDRVLRAVRDFEYDLLRVELKRDGEGLLAHVHTHGKGRVGERPQELYLTWNIRGLEELLNETLGLQAALGGSGRNERK